MPQSRNRPKHYQHVHHQTATNHRSSSNTKRSAALVVAVIAAIMGLAVAYFTQGADIFWLIVGTAIGALLGYVVGRSMDKSIAGKQ